MAWALECKPVGPSLVTAAPGCVYGAPAKSGDLWLVPRTCRLQVDGKWLDRHTVEARRGAAKVSQSSLPPQTVTNPLSAMPGAGEVLGGAYPLLVLPHGLAAIDAKTGRAEWVFESTEGLLAVARLGDLLALAELAPAEAGKPAGLQLTVLDYDAGEVLGEARLHGTTLDSLSLVTSKSGAVDVVLVRTQPTRKVVEMTLPVRDADGKSPRALREAKARDLPLPASTTTVAGCPSVGELDRAHTGRPSAVITTDAKADPTTNAASQLPWTAADRCLVAGTPDATGKTWAWLQAPDGQRALRTIECK